MTAATATTATRAPTPTPAPGATLDEGQATRLTLRALAGSALGVLPLLQLFNDTSWLVQAWIAMAIVIVPAALIRLWRSPSVVHLVPGLIVLIGYLTRVYLPDHAWLGVVPTLASRSDLQAMSTALGTTVRDSAAPLDSTAPIRFYLSLGLVALALVVDVVVVELRRPALAGVPLLLVFTLAGAVPRNPVSWVWFALAGAGYLLILSSRSMDDLRSWGRVVARPERPSGSRLTTALSGRRIGLVAILAAVLVPFILPLGSVNVLANALHNGHVGVGGDGKGSTGVVIDPLAVLRGQLTKSAPTDLFTVDVTGAGAKSAFYLRTAVLETYTGKAWVPGPSATPGPATGNLTMAPSTFGASATPSAFQATVTVAKLGGTPPVFATPSQLAGLPKDWQWNSRYGVVSGTVASGQHYTEKVAQPDPSTAALEASDAVRTNGIGTGPQSSVIEDNLKIADQPKAVTDLVSTITAGKATPYDKARALSTYFTDPANGFVYSLQTKGGESGNELVDFLTTGKSGFCQQYAAALGVMLRVAGIPARVVVGYTHPAPNASGQFVVTSDDAHAWVEAYFSNIGWLPFDPTPLTGVDAARAVALPWAPHPVAQDPNALNDKPRDAAGDTASGAATANQQNQKNAANHSSATTMQAIWLGAVILALIAAISAVTPWLVRVRRRRKRLRRARAYGPEPLWDEIADTARDLGIGWSNARTTRQVAVWLGEFVSTDAARASLNRLSGAVERARYAASGADNGWPQPHTWPEAVADLEAVRSELIAAAAPGARWHARLLSESLLHPKSAQVKPDPQDRATSSQRTGVTTAGQ